MALPRKHLHHARPIYANCLDNNLHGKEPERSREDETVDITFQIQLAEDRCANRKDGERQTVS